MPVSFENSALKMSFSLSSLQPSSDALEGCEHARVERPYNSLTKKPKCRQEKEKEAWRRSWGGRDDNRDEFWAALQSNYNYLMDNQLIDTCKEASGELSWDEQDISQQSWSFSEFVSQFSELYSWLNRIQEAVYCKEESVADKNSHQGHMEELRRRLYRRKLFNEQGHQLAQSRPDTREEVAWRLAALNSRWDVLEQACQGGQDQLDHSLDMDQEVRCLRRWIRDMEARLHPLDFRTGLSWSLQELEDKARTHVVLQVDIASHGKVVCSVVKLCERAARNNHHNRRDAAHALRLARSLERRWHHLYLRAIEWQCHIEGLADRLRGLSPSGASVSDSDEEPVPKYPRLSGDIGSDHLTDDGSYFEDELEELSVMDTSPSSALQTDEDTAMVVTPDSTALVNGNCSAADVNDNYKSSVLNSQQDDDSRFDRSTRHRANFASFYLRHLDTDSEQDRCSGGVTKALTPQKLCPVVSGIDESSDEEWTYTNGGEWKGESGEKPSGESDEPDEVMEEAEKQSLPRDTLAEELVREEVVAEVTGEVDEPDEGKMEVKEDKLLPRETIEKLVNQAEELVREEVTSELTVTRVFEPLVFTADTKTKSRRVRDWLRLNPGAPIQLQDSCDASGEYTTGDSDDEKGSDTSEDHNGSVSTCRQLSRSVAGSAEAFQDLDSTPVADKPATLGHPSSDPPKVVMRCRRQLGSGDRPWSVSAISQLGVSMASAEDAIASFSISESALHQLPGPTTPTAAATLPTAEETASSSLRRRKVRTRRKTLGRKSDSGSGGGSGGSGGSDSQQKKIDAMLTSWKGSVFVRNKSGSFSGSPSASRPAVPTRSSSDPVALVGSTSGEEEGEALSPKFKVGPGAGLVTVAPSLGLAEEQMSSFSEQAWDNYQEKYMSEPYSEELVDSETTRQLLDFGDDYRNCLDSQSDCMSSLSTNYGAASPVRRRRPAQPLGPPDSSVLDSDSDMEDIQHLVQDSCSQLTFSESVLTKLIAKGNLTLPTDFAEIVATAKENIRCLRPILVDVEAKGGMLTPQQCRDLRDMVVRWENTQLRAEEMQQMRTLEREVAAAREDIATLASKVADVGELQDRDQLEARIRHVENAMTQMVERKSSLLQLNMAVHHYCTSLSGATDQQPALSLKDSVAELYKLWDETYKRMSQYLSSLLRASETWKQFDMQLVELQTALRSDQVTLRVLDSALQGSGPSSDIASSVRDVAKVLSEKQTRDSTLELQEMEVVDDGVVASLILRTGEGGSLSDSGISDSGSEQEMSEREKRLAVLRRLARNLEAVLSPGCTALVNILRRIEQTELELKNLQNTCRDLIFRTAIKGPTPESTTTFCSSSNHVASNCPRKQNAASTKGVAPDADPEDPDSGRKFLCWLWRVIKASFPFQVALLALLCFVCLVEPRCCDAMNNFGLSFGPQLRYVRGPPPV